MESLRTTRFLLVFLCLGISRGQNATSRETECVAQLKEELHTISKHNQQLKIHLADLVQDIHSVLDRKETEQALPQGKETPYWFKDCLFPSNGVLANGQVITSTDSYGQRVLVFQCSEGFTLVGNKQLVCHAGSWQGTVPRCAAQDCLAHYVSGFRENGVYGIVPEEHSQIWTSCDMREQGGGWTVIQRRMDGRTDFYRDYRQYQHGFGYVQASYWLGLDALHALTRQESELYVDLVANETHRAYARYSIFMVAGREDSYQMTLSGFTGSDGDSLTGHSGKPFSTYDRDQDLSTSNCAQVYHGAWWYTKCHASNLNGWYLNGPNKDKWAKGVHWKTFTGYEYSLKTVVMKVRRKKPS